MKNCVKMGGTVDENQVPKSGVSICKIRILNIVNCECGILYFQVNWRGPKVRILYNIYVRNK